jgi:hypothetical protein
VWNWCHAGMLFLGKGCFAPGAREGGPDDGFDGTCVLVRGNGSQGRRGVSRVHVLSGSFYVICF